MRVDGKYLSTCEGRQHRIELWQSPAGIDIYPYLPAPTEGSKLSSKTIATSTTLAWKNSFYFHLGLAVFEPRDFMRINAMLNVKRCMKAQLCSVSWRPYSPGPIVVELWGVVCIWFPSELTWRSLRHSLLQASDMCVGFFGYLAVSYLGMAAECKWKGIILVTPPVQPYSISNI